MSIYAGVDEDGFIVVQTGLEDPDGHVGPPTPPPTGPYTYHLIPARITGRPEGHRLKWNGGNPIWVDARTLAEARADKVSEMRAECDAKILGGFKSSALGTEHLYPAKLTDQTNLAGSILDSLIPGPTGWTTPFWCADSAGVWAFRAHTAAQIQQVGRDGKAAILAAMTTNEGLRAEIMTAPNAAAVDVIAWPS